MWPPVLEFSTKETDVHLQLSSTTTFRSTEVSRPSKFRIQFTEPFRLDSIDKKYAVEASPYIISEVYGKLNS